MFRVIGAILFLMGVTIGAGMLALPMVTASAGIISSVIFLGVVWIIMLVPAFYILELCSVNPKGAHLITIARNTLGFPGVIAVWLVNCLLLYSILSAYISAGGGMVVGFSAVVGYHVPMMAGIFVFAMVMSVFVIPGLRVTGFFNAIFMLFKGVFYCLLVFNLLSHATFKLGDTENFFVLHRSLLVGVLAFSYSMMIPTLNTYLDYNKKKLKLVLVIGTILPLIIYVLWVIALKLVIPMHGPGGLIDIAQAGSVYLLDRAIVHFSHSKNVIIAANGFTSVCLLTTFLAASVCLSDVIADGLKMKKVGLDGVIVYGLTYIPPLVVSMFIPALFIIGTNYAGIFALLLLLIFPALMAYSARYKKQLLGPASYQVVGGKGLIFFIILVGIAMMIIGFRDLIVK